MNEVAILNQPQNVSQSIIDSMTLDNVDKTLKKISDFHTIIRNTLNPATDFGIIPGTNKPTLLKPGAETICMLFGLTTNVEILSVIPQQLSKDTEFVSYTIKCKLYKNDYAVSEGVGTCNSFEKKYKNQDALNVANTIMKMAEKRALVDAVLHVASLSAVFTQDIEDMQDYMNKETVENMTVEEASKMKLNIGKQKGKTLGEVYKTDSGWIKWFLENGRDEKIKKAIEILSNAAKQFSKNKKNKQSESAPKEVATSEVDTETGEIISNEPVKDLEEEAAGTEKLPWDM